MANKRENGQAMIIFAVSVVVLLVFTGLAVDSCNLYMTRRNTQTTADSAALASGLAIAQGKDQTAAAQKVATLNGLKSSDITVNYPPTSGQFKDNTEYVQVFVKSKAAMSFMGMIGFKDTEVKSEAVVHLATGSGLLGGDAILVAADPSNYCASFSATNGIKLDLHNGGIFVNSTCAANAYDQSGGSKIEVYDGTISVVGGYTASNGAQYDPTPSTGAAKKEFKDIAAPDCTKVSNFSSNASYSINQSGDFSAWASKDYYANPGVYLDTLKTGNGMTVHLNPGLYCLKAGISIAGGTKVYGNNVTFVMLGGDLDMDNGAWIEFTAPSSDKYYTTTDGSSANFKGLLFLANPSVYSGHTFTYGGGTKITFTGSIYAPNTDCVYDNGTKDDLFDIQMICKHITLKGGIKLDMTYNKSSYYSGDSGYALQLAR